MTTNRTQAPAAEISSRLKQLDNTSTAKVRTIDAACKPLIGVVQARSGALAKSNVVAEIAKARLIGRGYRAEPDGFGGIIQTTQADAKAAGATARDRGEEGKASCRRAVLMASLTKHRLNMLPRQLSQNIAVTFSNDRLDTCSQLRALNEEMFVGIALPLETAPQRSLAADRAPAAGGQDRGRQCRDPKDRLPGRHMVWRIPLRKGSTKR